MANRGLPLLSAGAIRKAVARVSPGRHAYDRRAFEALRQIRDWRPGDTILDVGANDGRTALRLLQHLPAPDIIAFEPVQSTYERLLSATPRARVKAEKLALGAVSDERTIYLHAAPTLNSFDPDWSEPSGSERVNVDTLDGYTARNGIGHISLLKIDTEGHDLAVLQGARNALQRGAIEIIMVEAGFDAPGPRQPSLADFQAFLSPYQYFLHGIHNQCRARLSSRTRTQCERDPDVLVYCDAIFVGPTPQGTAQSQA